MPELPEVETVRLGLEKAVLSREILSVKIYNANLRFKVPASMLEQQLPGSRIEKIERLAKYLILRLNNNSSLIVHLGMSGKLFISPPTAKIDKHDHVIFSLAGDEQLRFRDPRRFGLIDLCATNDLPQYSRFIHLGLDPTSRRFNTEYCLKRALGSSRPVKNLLMDASFVTGLGNIYANEALFDARIHPNYASGKLTREEWRRLTRSIRSVLKAAIARGGTTLKDEGFRNVLGTGGLFQLNLKVYDKEGQACPRCGSEISRLVQQGRSSFVCENCQKIRARD